MPHKIGYPLFLDLSGREVMVIGGGSVASRKVSTLIEYGAHITVIAPEVDATIEDRASQGDLTWIPRTYRQGDLAQAFLVFSACGDQSVDVEVVREAHARNCLVNVVDVTHLCDFIVPSTIRRGALGIAISTSGAAPFEAKAIRHDLEQRFDWSWEPYLDLIAQVRTLAKQRVLGDESRRTPLYEAIRTSGLREQIAHGSYPSAEHVLEKAAAACGISLEEVR